MDGPSLEPGLALARAVEGGGSRGGTMLPQVEKSGIGPRTWRKRGGTGRRTKDGEPAPGDTEIRRKSFI